MFSCSFIFRKPAAAAATAGKPAAAPKVFLAPPISFVKHYMETKKITTRVDESTWTQIKNAWLKLENMDQSKFKSKPFKGLTLDRRLDAEQKSKVLSGKRD